MTSIIEDLSFRRATASAAQGSERGKGPAVPGFILRRRADIAEIQNQWWELWKQSDNQDPFARPDWVAAHVDAFEDRESFFLVCAGEKESLLAVLPLLIDRLESFHGLPVRRLRAAANAQTFRISPLYDPSVDTGALADAIISVLDDAAGWDLLELPCVPAPGFGDALTRAAQERGMLALSTDDSGSMFIPLNPSATSEQPWLAELSGSMRSKLRKHLRQVESELGALRLQGVCVADPRQLALFYEIEASGWKGQSRTAIASNPQTRGFYDAIASSFSSTGSFYLDILFAGEKPVAGSFSVSYRNRFLPLKWGYDEQYERFSPGNLLVAELLRRAWQDGFELFDLSPTAEYKKRWTQVTAPAKRYYIFRGLYGRLLYTYKAHFRPGAKSLFQRWTRSETRMTKDDR
jgi:CelD/BcsL family acetyltransferase involved in cellulose biosynthesis